jgi:hypothetical protein
VVLLRDDKNNVLQWAGTDAAVGNERNSSPFTSHIMYLDHLKGIDLQVATSTHLKVCNQTGEGTTGYLRFLY